MKCTFLTLALAAQLAAAGAVAQTTSSTTGTTDSGVMSDSFGSDWSKSLGSAMIGEDGATVRTESEIATQWETLSDEDKEMVRRDCEKYTEQSEGTTDVETGSATTTTDSTVDTSQSGTSDTTTGSSSTDTTPMNVTMEQMAEICAATDDL